MEFPPGIGKIAQFLRKEGRRDGRALSARLNCMKTSKGRPKGQSSGETASIRHHLFLQALLPR